MDKGYRSLPEYFFAGTPRKKRDSIPPVHALCNGKKNAILRNINRLNILILANRGFLRTIAQFLTMLFFTPDLPGSGQFSAKKVVIWYVSWPEKPVATKIFINSQIERKYNPFR